MEGPRYSAQNYVSCGAQIVESYSGFGTRQGIQYRVISSLRFIKFLILQGGNKGYFQIHTHTPELRQFNEKGWNDCYVRIAEMLELHPNIKGVFGGSWFYDPKLLSLSPNLMYLQNTPLMNGASSFYIGKDRTGNAISKSKTRKKLFDEGSYDPEAYLLIWPRAELITWANMYKRDLREA